MPKEREVPARLARVLVLVVGAAGLAQAQTAAPPTPYECLIEPMQAVDIRSPVVGLLDKVHVRRGDRVNKGDVVATLESGAERAATELARLRSEMTGPELTAQSKITFSQRKFARRRDMVADKLMSGQEQDEAESELKLAESELVQARENRQLARVEWQQQGSLLNLRTIRSPFSGVVVDQLLYPGEVVEPGAERKPILKLAQLDPLRVHVMLPITRFSQIKPGASAQIVAEAPFDGRYSGKVTVVDRLIDAASGTFGLFVELPNPRHEIPAGIKCRAEFAGAVPSKQDSKVSK
jgi:RND family efflux transporter MFP subunit